jgi:hypothetical protein
MINSKYLSAPLLFSLFTLSACSSKIEPKSHAFFRTEIRDDNSKEFTFSVVFSRSKDEASNGMKNASNTQRPDKRRGSGKGRGNRSQDDSTAAKSTTKTSSKTEKLQTIFQQHLDLKMKETKYCKAGYLTLEKSFVGAIYSLRGECNESATKEDRNQLKKA